MDYQSYRELLLQNSRSFIQKQATHTTTGAATMRRAAFAPSYATFATNKTGTAVANTMDARFFQPPLHSQYCTLRVHLTLFRHHSFDALQLNMQQIRWPTNERKIVVTELMYIACDNQVTVPQDFTLWPDDVSIVSVRHLTFNYLMQRLNC